MDSSSKGYLRFRVLIIGRRGAGKTTILEKMAGSEEGTRSEIRDKEGRLVNNPALVKAGLKRGMSVIDYEITYPSNPHFVFHDSRGIEAGAEPDSHGTEAEEVHDLSMLCIQKFINDRAKQRHIRYQLHAIWFCMPMDTPRVPSGEFELAFLNDYYGVPVIAILTKYEALVDRVKHEFRGRQTKRDVLNYAKVNILDPLINVRYAPAAIVQTHHKGEGCELLLRKTVKAIEDKILATIFEITQQTSMKFKQKLAQPIHGHLLPHNQTALHIASEHGDPDILRFLIKLINPDVWNEDQEIPPFLSRKEKLKAAGLLSEHGTDINSQDLLGRTPLHVAAENGHCDIAHLLLDQGADIDAQDKMNGTPLHAASQQGHHDLARLLLEHHADILALNHEGHTFIDVAWTSGHEDIIDLNARYKGGRTALHIAAHHGDTRLMSWLIRRNLDPNMEDEDQETPLFPASKNGRLDATRLLLDKKAKVNHRDGQKMTPLHWASKNGHDAVVHLLIKRKAEVNAKDKKARIPLHLASRAGRHNVAKVLLDKKAMVDAKDDSNWTPLHMASQEGHLDVVVLLLAHGADVNIQNAADETALHLAAFHAHLDVAQVLLDRGADLQIKNKRGEIPGTLKSEGGKTLLELALERGDENMARDLCSRLWVETPNWVKYQLEKLESRLSLR